MLRNQNLEKAECLSLKKKIKIQSGISFKFIFVINYIIKIIIVIELLTLVIITNPEWFILTEINLFPTGPKASGTIDAIFHLYYHINMFYLYIGRNRLRSSLRSRDHSKTL